MTESPERPEVISLGDLAERIGSLQSALDGSAAGDGPRDHIRRELVTLAQEIDAAVKELEALRESLRPLAQRYKEVYPSRIVARERLDHLGSSTYRERGWSALAACEYAAAVEQFEAATELDPDDISARVLLAVALLRTGEYERARELLSEVLARQPGDPLARATLGYHQVLTGSFGEAIPTLTEVAKGSPDRTATLYANLYLGMAYAARDMHRDAQTFLRRALELGPNLTEAYWELGRSHQREGRADLALEAWREGGQNRFNPWGERCRAAADEFEAGRAAGES
ncbi:MAG TPA: tetratricopeptide repeat protein [Longimicrobiaceae bacterium]|nr:tetratricopeptide repeat protein [Longimicrobiaceae bacterium]